MKILIANWKMAPETSKGAIDLAKKTYQISKSYKKSVDIMVAVPFAHIATVVRNAPLLKVGAQDISNNVDIAHTGQVSANMIRSYGATYSIVGHSEARASGDTNEIVNEKIKRLLEKKIQPVLCVGEKSRDSQGWYLSEIKEQLEICLDDIASPSIKKIIIAYEPVWAIGSKAEREATPGECQEMIIFIRKILTDKFDEKISSKIPILYGGSVTEENGLNFIKEGGSNGLLVGRLSLDAKRFAKLVDRISR